MSYSARVIADSIAFGVRLTTIEATYPRFILAEDNTHRDFSRNSASSRAIPVERRIEQVLADPFIPAAFSKNKAGMQADGVLESDADTFARVAWLNARDECVRAARLLASLGAHKQHANRLIELWSWHTVVKTATEWDNYMNLRVHPDAQPEMQHAATLMRDAKNESTPRELTPGQWHLPYVDRDEIIESATLHNTIDTVVKISVAKTAAVSFERQYVEKPIEQYVARHDSLQSSGHMSPFEHQARCVRPIRFGRDVPKVARWHWHDEYPIPFGPRYKCVAPDDYQLDGYFCGNLRAPWLQYRKMLSGEAVFTR